MWILNCIFWNIVRALFREYLFVWFNILDDFVLKKFLYRLDTGLFDKILHLTFAWNIIKLWRVHHSNVAKTVSKVLNCLAQTLDWFKRYLSVKVVDKLVVKLRLQSLKLVLSHIFVIVSFLGHNYDSSLLIVRNSSSPTHHLIKFYLGVLLISFSWSFVAFGWFYDD